ncbi:transposase [Gordonia sp. C13]|uniref:transposase n=1 Tax=Gordonia sp. C13 TaxID=2935078 RepID=UPI00200A465E|nr:transposase [Gordonia sp. C13]MCK8615295.1 transposase [Gordonia sp. C13]
MSAPDSTRRYGWIDAEIRELAVATVRDLLPHVESLWAACCEVSKQLSVHPNTIKNWYRGAVSEQDTPPAGTNLELTAAREQMRALQRLNANLVEALKDRGTPP